MRAGGLCVCLRLRVTKFIELVSGGEEIMILSKYTPGTRTS